MFGQDCEILKYKKGNNSVKNYFIPNAGAYLYVMVMKLTWFQENR